RPAVGGNGDGPDLLVVHELADLLAFLQIPDAHAHIDAAGEGAPAVAADGQAVDEIAMPGHALGFVAVGQVPDAQGEIVAGGQDVLLVGEVVDAADPVGVAAEGADRVAGVGVPGAHGL